MTLIQKRNRIRRNIKVLNEKKLPRLCVVRSAKHIYAQIIDSKNGKVLAQFSSLNKEFKLGNKKSYNIEGAKYVGEIIGQKARQAGIDKVIFDRSGYIYHGKIKALADAVRQSVRI